MYFWDLLFWFVQKHTHFFYFLVLKTHTLTYPLQLRFEPDMDKFESNTFATSQLHHMPQPLLLGFGKIGLRRMLSPIIIEFYKPTDIVDWANTRVRW
ncbi:uncharacterized protein DS421_10g312010 [Arachis hypogaea]|nr:uncharacterized protein DS421_10g312010 [Arachis hypogaea]